MPPTPQRPGGQPPQRPRRQPRTSRPQQPQPVYPRRPSPRPRVIYREPPVRHSAPLSAGVVAAVFLAIIVFFVFVLSGGHLPSLSSHAGSSSGKSHVSASNLQGIPSNVAVLPCQLPTTTMNDACQSAKRYAYWSLNAIGQAGEFGCLDALWNHESNWNAWAVGPPTTKGEAQGIPQALGHGNVFSLGEWQKQVDWGLNYIYHGSGNFHDSCGAWAFETSHYPNWY